MPMRARISERIGHSGPTVSQTVARMERDGLVIVAEDRRLELTDEGRTLATRVLRKHRLAERLLTEEHVAVIPGRAFGPSGAGHVPRRAGPGGANSARWHRPR